MCKEHPSSDKLTARSAAGWPSGLAIGKTDPVKSPSSQVAQAPRITAVVLTLNEEVNIQRCLLSLSWADEVVVVDSNSTDRTVDIARASGARVVRHRQTGTYLNAEQRNWALEHADLTGDWILFVDADEAVPVALAEEIRERCQNDVGLDAYQLAPKYLFWGRWMRRCMRYPAWHDRLLRSGQANFTGGVWEHFSAGPRLGRIAEPYLHYGNSKGFEDWLERHSRYSSWDATSVLRYLDTTDPRALERLVGCYPGNWRLAFGGYGLSGASPLCISFGVASSMVRRPLYSAFDTHSTSTWR